MKRKILVILLAISLVGAFSTGGAAQVLGYNMDKTGRGFQEVRKGDPSSGAVFADAVIGKPLGLGTTLLGTGLFVVISPLYAWSGHADQVAWDLIGKPGGWTFVRPLGRGDARFEDPGVFPR